MATGRKKAVRRGKGRPTASESGVGRDALISAAQRRCCRNCRRRKSPARAIARRANADPALVRYYFGNRENLLFEVAKQIGAEANRPPPDEGDPMRASRRYDPQHLSLHPLGQAHAAADDRGAGFRQLGRSARKDARMEPPAAVELCQAAGARRRRQAEQSSIRCSCTSR